ncbi:MAG: small conductance mechanosensitive channel [Cryomorphaceae bacterium]|jgi:small conductance mechanosensitive channel
MEQYQQTIETMVNLGSAYAIKVVLALLIFLIGKRIARVITNLVTKAMTRNDVDVELVGFFNSLIYWGLFAIVIITALGQLGVQTASLIAVLGATGLAIGLALQGSLSNFAAGVLIILLRPIRVGEFVEIAGASGRVENIRIFTTELRTGDNKCVIIPNARVLDSNIVNHSSTGTRRVDLTFGIGYDDDIDKARAVIKQIVDQDPRVLDEPATQIAVSELADSSVNFVVRPWVKTDDYWGVYMDMNELVKKRFDEENISIPFPQSTITIVREAEEEQDK